MPLITVEKIGESEPVPLVSERITDEQPVTDTGGQATDDIEMVVALVGAARGPLPSSQNPTTSSVL